MNCGSSSNAGWLALARSISVWLLFAWLHAVVSLDSVQGSPAAGNEVKILEREGTVEAQRLRATVWQAVDTNQVFYAGERLQTAERSRALLRLLDQTTMRMFELSEFLIQPLPTPSGKPGFSLMRGLLYFLHRDKPADVRFQTPTASAAIRGTEFHIAVEANGRTVITMFDGEVELANALGTIRLVSGEQGVVDPGQAPVKTPLIATINIIQWCLYYPGVLAPDDLSLSPAETAALQSSLDAYRAGDLLQALAAYPAGRQPASASEKVYFGAVLLSVGQVEPAESLFNTLGPDAGAAPNKPSSLRLAAAIRRVIAAVKNQPDTNGVPAAIAEWSATEWLAESYVQQSRARLSEALQAARAATIGSSQFGFGWARVAELEFSFGRTAAALEALDKGLRLSPRNAEAVSLRGFLFSAQNRIRAAQDEFDRAIAFDGALGNAWLGRGLCKIRRGQLDAGREDLQIAATLEPQRALFRSYLGKAWNQLAEKSRAARELELAKERDPKDPTAALYSALLLQQGNRINEAIEELEHSQELNDNRRVYRSRLLLDQDRAVRGANLANIYRDAGMTDWSVREAGKAVNADYGNYSAHLFLANSFNELRDPGGVNVRYETPWLSEYLLANLLGPVGAGTLSQSVSQQEYSKLFERNRLGLVSDTEYLSRGAWSQGAAQYGLFGNSAYAVEGNYFSDPGEHVNGDVEHHSLNGQVKQQVSGSDSLYAQAATSVTRSGDINQYFDFTSANPVLRVRSESSPVVLAGWHHEWNPGSHLLVLGSYAEGVLRADDPLGQAPTFSRENGHIFLLHPTDYGLKYDSEQTYYGVEAQQLWQVATHSLVAGVRVQGGSFDATATQVPFGLLNDNYWQELSGVTNIQSTASTSFDRLNAYLYDAWQALPSLQLIGGITYDHLRYPLNHRYAPIQDDTATVSRAFPKAGLIWQPGRDSALRFAYTRSLAGPSFDQSFRLEPPQVAGFNQAYRSVIPETITGASAGVVLETFDAALEFRFGSRTYVSVFGEILKSDFVRWIGAYDYNFVDLPKPSHLEERLDYEERSAGVALDQLLGKQWVVGLRYRLSRAELERSYATARPLVQNGFLDENDNPALEPSTKREAGTLHALTLQAVWNNPRGFYAATDATWNMQVAEKTLTLLPDASFWLWNARLGWRSPQRHMDVSVGLLNLLNEDTGLHPINLHLDAPRQRTLALRLQWNL